MSRARAILCALASLALAAGAAVPAQAHQRAPRHHRAHHHRHAPRPLGVVSRRGGPRGHARARAAGSTRPPQFTYHRGPVMHSSTTYAIYWLPPGYQFGSDSAGFESIVSQYLTDVAADSGLRSNVYSTDPQYTDPGGRAAYQSQFGGAVEVHDPLPASGCTVSGYSVCINDAQVEAEIDSVIKAQGWARGPNALFVIFTAQGVGSCFDAASATCDAPGGYCAYHAQWGTEGGQSQTLYADIPYSDVSGCTAGQYPHGSVAADSAVNLVSHEHNEAVTDPWGDAWYDQSGNENGDLCAWNFMGVLGGASGAEYNQVINGGHYYLQPEWSNADGGACVMNESRWLAPSSPSFTVTPGGVQAPKTSLQFTAAAAGASVATPSYGWSFGDGTSGTGISTTHSYQTPGTWTATLTVTDAFGATASAAQQVLTQGPIADIALPPSPVSGTALTFGPGATSDTAGTITSYAWTFGDGGTASAASPQHTYAAAGAYTVTLTVTDSNGYSATATRTLTVAAPAPPPAAPQQPAPATTVPATAPPAPAPSAAASTAVPRLTIARIAGVRLRRGRGVLVLHVRASSAGRVTIAFAGARATFSVRAGANTLRLSLRGAHRGRRTATIQAAGPGGARGRPLARRVTLR